MLSVIFYVLYQNFIISKESKLKFKLMAKEKEKLIMKLDNLKIKNLRKKAFSDSSHDQLFKLYQSNKPKNYHAKNYIPGQRTLPDNENKLFKILEYTHVFGESKVLFIK